MRALALPRRQLQFALLASFVVAAECMVLARRRLSTPLEAAVVFDLCVFLPGVYWLLVSRERRKVARVALIGVALCAVAFGRELRLLGLPLEMLVVYELYKSPVVRTELAIFRYALFSWFEKPAPGFTGLAGWPAIYVAVSMMLAAEGIPLHFVLPRGWAVASAALHLYALLWIAGDWRAMKLRPIQVRDGLLLLRVGLRWSADIPLRDVEVGAGGKGLKLGLSPNLVLKLRQPVTLEGPYGIRKTADALLLQVDDPAGLARAISGSSGAAPSR